LWPILKKYFPSKSGEVQNSGVTASDQPDGIYSRRPDIVSFCPGPKKFNAFAGATSFEWHAYGGWPKFVAARLVGNWKGPRIWANWTGIDFKNRPPVVRNAS